MTAPAIPLKEFDEEMKNTRRLLERVPTDKGKWKPHDKSFSLGHLAQLVAWMPGWIDQSLRNEYLDLKGGGTGEGGGTYSYETTETLLKMFDDNVAKARKSLAEVTGPKLDEPWSLKMGNQVLMTTPRGEVVRQHLNHLIHHRAQLTVYARLIDVPLPMMYGPTADENPWRRG